MRACHRIRGAGWWNRYAKPLQRRRIEGRICAASTFSRRHFMGFFRLGMVGGALLGVVISARAEQPGEWPNVGNDKGGMRYSTLTGINKQNVKDLVVVWTYHTGDAGQGTTIECTPLVVDGAMYVTTVKTQVVALDAANGKQIWKYDPYAGPAKPWI